MKKFKFSIDGNQFEVSVNELEDGKVDVTVNGSNYIVDIDREGTKSANQTAVNSQKMAEQPSVTPVAATKATTKTIKSQLPGSIVKIVAAEGQTVKKGDTVMTIESMKMENNISAEADGTISKIYVEPGKSVMQDDKLYDIDVVAAVTPIEPKVQMVEKYIKKTVKKEIKAQDIQAGNGKPLKAPLPGSIIKILVSEGQAVKRGDTLLTMESMKMENEIKAEKDGVVTAIKVTPGQSVMQDDDLVMMA